MRNSIRFKMTSILILIVGWVIVFTWFLNNTFSEKYYVSSEKASIVKTFDKVKNILKMKKIRIPLMRKWNRYPIRQTSR